MCTVKTQKHRFPFIIISTIVIHIFMYREISKYRRSALLFNANAIALTFCFDFSSFQTAHRNKNKLRLNKTLRKMSVVKI